MRVQEAQDCHFECSPQPTKKTVHLQGKAISLLDEWATEPVSGER